MGKDHCRRQMLDLSVQFNKSDVGASFALWFPHLFLLSFLRTAVPTTVSLEPPTLTVPKGNHADFVCRYTVDERADPTIKWYLNEVEINPDTPGSDYSLMDDITLRVKSAKSTQSGTFKCEVSTEYDMDFAESELIVQGEWRDGNIWSVFSRWKLKRTWKDRDFDCIVILWRWPQKSMNESYFRL